MHRKEFIKNCGYACLGSTALIGLLQGCNSTKILQGSINGSDLLIPLKEFEIKSTGGVKFKNSLLIQNDILQYPVCVFRLKENEYTALWMQCTHQGTELQVFGDKLQCPAHGSEFDNRGNMQNGPAISGLRTFPVIVENDMLKISLKKQQ